MRFLGSGSVRLTHYRFLQHFRFLILSVMIAHHFVKQILCCQACPGLTPLRAGAAENKSALVPRLSASHAV